MTVEEALTVLKAATKTKLLVEIEKKGETYVIPLELLGLLLDPDYTLTENHLGPIEIVTNGPNTGAESAYTVPAEERWFVEQVHSQIVCDATVIARAHILTITDPDLIPLFGYLTFASGTVTLTAGETGSVMECGGAEWLNDNGTFTRTVGSMVPHILEGNAVITTATGNLQAGDVTALRVKYRRVA